VPPAYERAQVKDGDIAVWPIGDRSRVAKLLFRAVTFLSAFPVSREWRGLSS
jgi:hypothetical protein